MTATPWFIYLIRTGAGSLYTGITTDVPRRLSQHQRGAGAKALRGKGPLTLVFYRQAGARAEASRWEYRIKQLTKGQKERLVTSQAPTLEELWCALLPTLPAGRPDSGNSEG